MRFFLLLFVVFGLFVYGFSQECLVADYPFHGNTLDESGNDFHGAPIGVTLTSDRFGNENSAYLFDGEDDFIEVNGNVPIITKTEFTISIWARRDGVGGGIDQNSPLFTQRDNVTVGGSSSIVLDGENSSDKLAMNIRASASSSYSYHISTVPSLNEWHHYVSVYELTDTLRMYIDGVELPPVYAYQPGNFTSSIDFVQIGAQWNSSQPKAFWNGAIDDEVV